MGNVPICCSIPQMPAAIKLKPLSSSLLLKQMQHLIYRRVLRGFVLFSQKILFLVYPLALYDRNIM